MNFGHYIKLLRTDLNWTQPEAAAKIGIEQSYLSKLETGKSIPSDEIFIKLQEAYQFDVNEMTDVIDSNELMKLIEITSVKESIQAMEKKKVTTTRSWLVAGLISLMLGGSFLGAAIIPDTSSKEYIYKSEGVLQPGEELTTFDKSNVYAKFGSKLTAEQRQDLIKRIDQKFVTLNSYRGGSFVESDGDGIRYYESVTWAEKTNQRFPKWFMLPGLTFLIGGLACFYIARVWGKPK